MSSTMALRSARKRAGLTTVETGRRVGVSDSAITLYETGRSTPSVGVLYLYAVAVGMTELAEALAPVVTDFPNAGVSQRSKHRKRAA